MSTIHTEASIVVEKQAQRQLQPPKMASQIAEMIDEGLSAGRKAKGWKIEAEPMEGRFKGGVNIYRWDLKVVYEGREKGEQTLQGELIAIAKMIAKKGKGSEWSVVSINDMPAEALIADKPCTNEEGAQTVDYAPVEIPPDWRKFFGHIYDREPQIDIIFSYIQAAIDSDWNNRFHPALVGHPASGKTETARAFKRMLGEEAVMELDATGTSMAAAINALKECKDAHCVPRVLIIEEIEKTDFKQFPWLLAMLDPRAEIRKLKMRSEIHMEAKLLCIATINNYKLFQEAMEGALASRFADPIFFPRPGKEILQRILIRDVDKVKNGDHDWIEPAIEIATEFGITDPRHILAICLAGKDELLTGRYQDKLRKTRMPADYLKNVTS